MITTTTVKPNGAGPDLAADERREELARQAIAMLAQVKGEVPPAALTWPQFSLAEGLALPPAKYLVYGAIGTGDIGMIYGDAAAGKTYLAIDLAICLAAGLPWMGRWAVPAPCKVLYFISEGRQKFFRRLLAAVNGMGVRGADVKSVYQLVNSNLIVCTEVPQLFDATAERHAANYVEFWRAQGAPKVDIFFIDTLRRASTGGDENTARDAGIIIDAAMAMQVQMGSAAITVHHSNKSGGYSGSTALRGNVDFVFKVEGRHREPRKLEIDKMRDGEVDGPEEGRNYTALFQVDQASGGTFTTWLEGDTGPTDKRQDARELARQEIFRFVGDGRKSQTEIVKAVQALSKNTILGLLNEMTATGELVETKGGPKNARYFELSSTVSLPSW